MNILAHDYAGHPFQVQLSHALAGRGHEVCHAVAGNLVTPRGNFSVEKTNGGKLSFLEVPMDPAYREKKYRFWSRRKMEREYGATLVCEIGNIEPEVVISGNTPTEPQWRAIKECKKRGIRFISWIQDFYGIAVDRTLRRKLPVAGHLVGWYYRFLDRRCAEASDAIICITEDFVPMLERDVIGREKVRVIPNWAPLEEIPVREKDNAWAREHGLEGKFVFMYTGTMAMKHNPDLVRQVASKFKDRSEVRVVVISEGPGIEYLRRKKDEEGLENLVLLPFQSFDRMPDVLGSADVLMAVLEPDAGVFSVPSKVNSYLAAGRPVLAAIPSENLASKIVLRNGAGLCVEPGDDRGWRECAERMYREPTLREECGRNGRKYAEEHFDIEKIADQFEEIIEFVTRRGSR